MSARERAVHRAWCALSREQRMDAGADWYSHVTHYPPASRWTRDGITAHQAKTRRAMSLLIAARSPTPADTRDMAAELDHARREMRRLRERADLGVQLAAAQSEALRLTALLTTDERFTGADTEPIALPTSRRSAS